MECNFDGTGRTCDRGGNVNDSDDKSPFTVTTLYYSCDSNIFQSSESSVQVVSASNYNATVGHCRPNYCELDIIAKKEKLKVNVDFVPLQTIAEELKSLPMTAKIDRPKTGFRKKIYHKSVGESADEPNDVLCLASILKDDVDTFQPLLTRSSVINDTSQRKTQFATKQEDKIMVDEICQTKKKKRSKSRRRKTENETTSLNEIDPNNRKKKDNPDEVFEQIQLDQSNPPVAQSPPAVQFADLTAAKTMYFAELPNTSPFVEKKSDKKKKKHKKSKPKSDKEEANRSSNIIVNKVENDFPPISSPGSITTVPSRAFKKNSDLSFGSLEVPKSAKTDYRRRNTSPNSQDTFLDDVLRKYKTDTVVYKGKHRKKHRTSPKSSSEEEEVKKFRENRREETELRVIYKVDKIMPQIYREKKRDKKRSHLHGGKKQRSHRSRSPKLHQIDSAKHLHRKRSKSHLKEGKLETSDGKEKIQVEDVNEKEDSILNLYQTNKPLKSESCTMITDEEYLKAIEKRKRKSRKSQSPSPTKKLTNHSTRKNEILKEKVPVEDLALLENAKERKSKQRSKSRVTGEKCRKKTRYKSKAPTPTEDGLQELTKKISRKSTSDLSKEEVENFDGHKSVEGVKKDKDPPEKKHHKKQVNVVEKFPYDIKEQTICQLAKEKRKRSKSYAPKKEKEKITTITSSKTRISDANIRSSDTKISKRTVRSKTSLLFKKNQAANVIPVKDKFLEEIQKKITSIQQIEESRKRFKVVSRTIRSKMSDGSSSHTTEASYPNRKLCGSNRFKAYMNAEKEKEAILRLPIFQNRDNTRAKDEVTIEIEESRRQVRHNYETSELEEGIVKEERSKKKKKIRRTISRKEVSFAHLNVSPLVDVYRKPSRNTFIRRALLPLDKRCFEIAKTKLHDSSKDATLPSGVISEDTDFSANKIEVIRKCSIFTIILGEKILEIYTKTIGDDGKIMEGFTVSGTEPPKKLRSQDCRKDKLKLMAKVSKLHPTYHPPIEITDGVMKMDFEIDADEEEIPPILEEVEKVKDDSILPTRTPILLKTKRKFVFASRKRSKSTIKKESTLKAIQTSTESRSNSDSLCEIQEANKNDSLGASDTIEVAEQTPWPSKIIQKQEVKSPSRMSSAVKLMESSLQIIKEESQSTDSSSRRSPLTKIQVVQGGKRYDSDIKETQTDINVDDIDKIKEVITYLYKSMDVKKTAVVVENKEETPRKQSEEISIKRDSSTESSSYHEQFKNFVRNVTPKFSALKKNSRSRTCISTAANSRIPTPTRRLRPATPTSIKSETRNIDAGKELSSSSSSSERKNVKAKKTKNQKNGTRRRSSSADVLTSGYFEKYKSTKALIEEQRQKRAESVDSTMRKRMSRIEPEFKSSTSVSDFSSVVMSFKDDPTPVRSDATEILQKRSDEKYVQCVLVADTVKELIDKNIGTITTDDENYKRNLSPSKSLIAKVKSSLSFDKESNTSKILEDKSLQTSVVKEDLKPTNQCKINVLYTDIPIKSSGKRKLLDDLIHKVSSHSFIVARHSPTKIDRDKSISMEKLNKFDRLRRYFTGKNEYVLKNNIISYNMSEKKKKSHSKRGPEADYMNLIKLEKHLEQVLGLYPSIFKAIRAQMDDSTIRKLDKRLKTESPELFTSYDTLATTIDTVTEYKTSDKCDRYPSFSESNLNRFNRYCESLNLPGQEYQLEQFINSQNALRQCFMAQFVNKKKVGDITPKTKSKKKMTTLSHPQTDTTSSSKDKKPTKNIFKSKKKKVKSSQSDLTTAFCSNSNCSRDNWSVKSPLYSITTPSVNFSILGRSQSSTSLMQNKPTQTKLTRSKSVIEMCSIGKINRKLALKHLVKANQEAKRDVLVVSVNSSCTVFATPSKFLSKVEKHLQKSEDVTRPEPQRLTHRETENKKQIDEQSFHSLFFSDSNVIKSPDRSEHGSPKPFYIHKKMKGEVSDEEFPDSLEVRPPTSSAKDTLASPDEEDLGNFSADSLESNQSKHKDISKWASSDNQVDITTAQNFFVYSNTVNYGLNAKDGDNREKVRVTPANPPRKVTTRKVSTEDTSKTLLSESGYESTKSKRTASIRNFFKKGGSLLDIFRNNTSKNKLAKVDNRNVTNLTDLWLKKNENPSAFTGVEDDYVSRRNSPCRSDNTVYWTTIKRDSSSNKNETTTFSEIAGSSRGSHRDKSQSPHRSKGSPSPTSHSSKKCPCSDPAKSYQRQMNACHAYAEKVVLESQMRREGYYKQYQEFKEIPLELLIGKRMPNKSKYQQEISVMTKPKCKPVSTQSRRHSKGKTIDSTQAVKERDSHADILIVRDDSPVKLSAKKSPIKHPIDKDRIMVDSMNATADFHPLRTDVLVYTGESRVRMSDKELPPAYTKATTDTESNPSRPSIKYTNRNFGKIIIKSSQSLHNFLLRSHSDAKPNKKDQATYAHISRKDKSVSRDSRPPEKSADKEVITRYTRRLSQGSSKSSGSRSRSKEMHHVPRGCTCDGTNVIPHDPPHKKLISPPPEEITEPIEEAQSPIVVEPTPTPPPTPPPEIVPESPEILLEPLKPSEEILVQPAPMGSEMIMEMLSSSSTASLISNDSDPHRFFIDLIVSDMVDQAMYTSDKKQQSAVVLPPMTEIEKQDVPALVEEEKEEDTKDDSEICRRSSEDFRKGLTDKEVFDKLLNSFEKEDEIATRLSKDEEFFKDQIKTIKKESDESIEEEKTTGADPNEIIYSEDPIGGKHRSTHFWEEKMKAMRAKEENPVKEDDIGTCFSRGFRPDNIALSGDACFSLNKQDRLKFSTGMLTNEESIIDFSERETPLDFLLALGFMVDEASNALKDEDIRSRLLAAITEARVWINKITTTQGTLLYLVAYKSRPKTMRYFLQLVEAIINKRINNAIKLDGFLRVLEKVEEGEIQMINILGADKFEDEENEEKIVKKQLRQLFITVYKIAEKEAMMKGKQLSQQAIVLLRILAAKYRAGLHPHLELIARYIGQDLLNTETQLEAAMIFLSRLDTAEVKLKEFEAYCDIKCDKRKKKIDTKLEMSLDQTSSMPEQGLSKTEINRSAERSVSIPDKSAMKSSLTKSGKSKR